MTDHHPLVVDQDLPVVESHVSAPGTSPEETQRQHSDAAVGVVQTVLGSAERFKDETSC